MTFDPDSSVFIISTGQSGHFYRHYDDLGNWGAGRICSNVFRSQLARGASIGTTNFTIPSQRIKNNFAFYWSDQMTSNLKPASV